MYKNILVVSTLLVLSACASSASKTDTYTDSNGKTTVIDSDRGNCIRDCNDDDARCMDTDPGIRNGGVHAPSGMFGTSADCRSTLRDCLASCKGR